jgi:ubiquinone/menaquinone biosynthesis C-methylase UbiE
MIEPAGWDDFSIWDHSQTVKNLYARRCRREAEEMTAHAQAAELLASRASAGDTLLDAGCGSGYFFHSLATRSIPVEYWGADASRALIGIGREIMPAFGLAAERLLHARLEDLRGDVDHAVCLNVLSNIDNYHRPLERLLRMARKSVILRESIVDGARYTYVRDDFLDADVDLNVHVNHYDRADITAFIERYGFRVTQAVDRRSGGKPELVIGYEHYWTFLIADRVPDPAQARS